MHEAHALDKLGCLLPREAGLDEPRLVDPLRRRFRRYGDLLVLWGLGTLGRNDNRWLLGPGDFGTRSVEPRRLGKSDILTEIRRAWNGWVVSRSQQEQPSRNRSARENPRAFHDAMAASRSNEMPSSSPGLVEPMQAISTSAAPRPCCCPKALRPRTRRGSPRAAALAPSRGRASWWGLRSRSAPSSSPSPTRCRPKHATYRVACCRPGNARRTSPPCRARWRRAARSGP